MRISRIQGDGGEPHSHLFLFADVTEVQRLSGRLDQSERHEAVGLLATGIAHDLNNALAPILMAAPVLRDGPSESARATLIETLEKSATRGAALVRQILDFANAPAATVRDIDLRHLLRDLAAILESHAPEGVIVEALFPRELPTVSADPVRLHEALMCIGTNALEALHAGGTLRLNAAERMVDASEVASIPDAQPGKFVRIEIADAGEGIDPAKRDSVWEPFFTTRERSRHFGLGLPKARDIVKEHGGFIVMTSTRGVGTSAKIFLPARNSGDAGAAPLFVPEPAPVAESAAGGRQILVVDDDPAVRDLTTAILTRYGYTVVSMDDSTEAVKLFSERTGQIALVVTDVNIPNLDGGQLIAVLQRLKPGIKVLAMSGVDPTRAVKDSEPPAASEFLMKPFKIEALIGAVRRLLPDEPKAGG
jgi:two-component system cell cycle sensor histidine kinase/response regulator CckA